VRGCRSRSIGGRAAAIRVIARCCAGTNQCSVLRSAPSTAMEIPVTAIRNMPSSGWRRRYRVVACCLTLTALALVIPGSSALARRPWTNPDVCSRAYGDCLSTCHGDPNCEHTCTWLWLRCIGGMDSGSPSKGSVSRFPISGPVKVIPGGLSNPVSGGNANPVSGAGNFSRSSATNVRLKTTAKYRTQSNQRRRR
jgi:hypothetical protein